MLSATPFRNDYKLFQVKGRFVFNYPFEEARDENIVRNVDIIEIIAGKGRKRKASGDEDTVTPAGLTSEDLSAVDDFVAGLKAKLPALLKASRVASPKVIVRSRSWTKSLSFSRSHWKRPSDNSPFLFMIGSRARPANRSVAATTRWPEPVRRSLIKPFGLHQSKLLEGIRWINLRCSRDPS